MQLQEKNDPSAPLDSLIVDTGSSNTWVGAGKAFRKTSSATPTNDTVVGVTEIWP